MRAEGRWEEVGAVLAACEEHWRTNGIPEDKVAEMSGELEGHLHEALADGKTVEDVVGADLEGFAEAWAAPNRPSRSLWEETLDVLSDTSVGLAVIAVAMHLYSREAAIPTNLEGALLTVVGAMLMARFFAFFRTPAEEPAGSEDTVLDRYPSRLREGFLWTLIVVWGIALYLPLPEVRLFDWPWQATLALPAAAVLFRAAKKVLPEPLRKAAPRPRQPGPEARSQQEQILDALSDCEFQWAKMRIPENEVEEMSSDVEALLDEAVQEGKTVESVIGPDPAVFAEDWAEGHGAEPDLSPEPLKSRLQGWVLSVSASAALLAAFFHLIGWTLYVPVAWVVGMYTLWLVIWFLSEPVSNFLDRTRYAGWKGMLSAGVVVLGGLGFAALMAYFFMGVGPMIPFEWPWYATIISALVAALVVYGWTKEA